MSRYDPSNWYWVVASLTTQVFASASLSFVPLTDATYEAWLALGNLATQIPTAAELAEVLQRQLSPIILAVGCAITSTGTPALNATYALDNTSQIQMLAIVANTATNNPLPGGGTTFNLPKLGGGQVALTAAQMVAIGSQLVDYVYAVEQAIENATAGQSVTLPSNAVTIA